MTTIHARSTSSGRTSTANFTSERAANSLMAGCVGQAGPVVQCAPDNPIPMARSLPQLDRSGANLKIARATYRALACECDRLAAELDAAREENMRLRAELDEQAAELQESRRAPRGWGRGAGA
jgi:hypothetical protein